MYPYQTEIIKKTNKKFNTGKWNKGASKTEEESLMKHYKEYGEEVGASSVEQYLKRQKILQEILKAHEKHKT